MTDFEKIWSFENLYKAHCAARLGKRDKREVIDFEMNLSSNLCKLSESLRNKTYRISGYYSFTVHDPKERIIHALHYPDRVVQHCICDEVLSDLLERRLIYDNAACRIGKGTHFALDRLTGFMREHYRLYGADGYVLRFDVHKFFDSIDHEILKILLSGAVKDKDVLELLEIIIDSYECTPGRGLPLGNQTSQWFALYYLDPVDRMIKEKLHCRFYSRYMDDAVIVHHDKAFLQTCLHAVREYAQSVLSIQFNDKTHVYPLRRGIDYLGWRLYLTDSGKVVKKLRQSAQIRYQRNLKTYRQKYAEGKIGIKEIDEVLNSYRAHLSYGHTYHLQEKAMSTFILKRIYNR